MKRILKNLLTLRRLTFAALVLIAMLSATWFMTPTFDQTVKAALGSDRVLLDRQGRVIQTLRTDFNKRRLPWQPLTSFPENLIKSVIEAEDRRFYDHAGIDLHGLTRALWANIRGHRVQGASTITMQVADLIDEDVLLRNQAIRKGSVLHKLDQIRRAVGINIRWSKVQVLEAYLNLIHLRGEFQGVPALTYGFLNKDPLALDDSETAAIASMIASPNQGSKALSMRACALSKRVSPAPQDCAATSTAVEKFFGEHGTLPASVGSAPHLARRIFQAEPVKSTIQSTLDSALQRDVASILDKNIERLRGMNVSDSAAIVIENATGRVLAYVGAVRTSESPHVDGVQSYRQAGSSLKPFFYGKAIEMKRLTSASILLDEPTAISWGGGVYRPTNYDKNFYGPVSVREALGSSLNVPAVKTVTVVGLHQAYQVLESLHFTGLKEPDYYGVSMALGAVEVRLDELANAYRAFANQGTWSPLVYTADATGSSNAREQIYSPQSSFIISSILSDPNARAIGFGWDSPLETPFWTAVKTGTSKDYRDNWCVGFSEKYTVAVWAGNFNSESMRKVSGVSGVGPSWAEIMVLLHRTEKSFAPKMPEGVVAKSIRHSWTNNEHTEYFLKNTVPSSTVIEASMEKRPEFVFPAEGSVLIRDPHQDAEKLALYVRFKGMLPPESRLFMDGADLGVARNPFKLDKFAPGSHELTIRAPRGETSARVHFEVRGRI